MLNKNFIKKKKKLIRDFKDEFEWVALWGEALEEERKELWDRLLKDEDLANKTKRMWHLELIEPIIEQRKEQIDNFNKRFSNFEIISDKLQKILEKNIPKKEVRKVKGVLVVLLAALLLGAVGALPVFAEGGVPPKLEITEEMMKEAKPAGDAIKITIAEEPKVELKWEKYLYVDVDQDLNADQQTVWTRVGLRKGDFDFSVGWTQKFNEPEIASQDKGIISVSFSIWW